MDAKSVQPQGVPYDVMNFICNESDYRQAYYTVDINFASFMFYEQPVKSEYTVRLSVFPYNHSPNYRTYLYYIWFCARHVPSSAAVKTSRAILLPLYVFMA
jgi:hypothetical protein